MHKEQAHPLSSHTFLPRKIQCTLTQSVAVTDILIASHMPQATLTMSKHTLMSQL